MKNIAAVAFISPQNHPILIRTFGDRNDEAIKYHYIAHTSLDVFEERVAAAGNAIESYIGLLYVMEDVAVYGYITAPKMKIVVALVLSDTVIRDADMIQLFKAFHMAYYASISNPFLKLDHPTDPDPSAHLLLGGNKWKGFRRRVDGIAKLAGVAS